MRRIRWFVPVLAVLMVSVALISTAGTAHADNCATGKVYGDFNLCYGSSVSGDVRVNGAILHDNDPGTGLVVTCWVQPACSGWVEPTWGANVSTLRADTIQFQLLDHGCGSKCYYVDMVTCPSARCPATLTQPTPPIYVPPVYTPPATSTSFSPGATVTGEIHYTGGAQYCQYCTLTNVSFYGYVVNGSVSYPSTPSTCQYNCYPPVYNPPVYPSGTSASWGNGSITIGASGSNSWIVINATGQTFRECWFPATPLGGGSAQNAVPNVVTVANPPPTNLPLCGPISTSNGLMEIRTLDWYPGQYTGVSGIAIALNNPPGTTCNSGYCTVDSTTAASVGGRVWFLAPAGSPANSVSPFTSATTSPQTPPTVYMGTTPTTVR